MRYDYHVHSTFSDGSDMAAMAAAARDAGLAGVGFADHCNVTHPEVRRQFPFPSLHENYERRRERLAALRERFDIELFDAVEMDYHPDREDDVAAFLERADFDYAVGSVHFLDAGRLVQDPSAFADESEAARRDAVESYFDRLVALVDSDLFEVAAHLDLVERNPCLRGFATEDDYERVAAAFADSRTVPEVNAGRALHDYGELHPCPTFLRTLADAGVAFTLGTDAHRPAEIADRVAHVSDLQASGAFERATLALDA